MASVERKLAAILSAGRFVERAAAQKAGLN